jgi:hypothetical protein
VLVVSILRIRSFQGPRRQYVLSFAQHAIWHQRQKVPDRTNEIIALVAQAESVVDKECLRVAVADLVARHPALRTTFQSHVSAGVRLYRYHGANMRAFWAGDAILPMFL